MKHQKYSKKATIVSEENQSLHPYELTIGMIVKNDVDRLRTCLESLQGLRDGISCQLIITDTGSTDGTREVAEEFADIFIDETWRDDFSKARNTGVEKAEGRWFLYLDSSHTLDESILSVVDFLKTKESYELDCASVTLREFHGSMTNLESLDMVKPLLFHCGKGKRYFQGRICEEISVDIHNSTYLPILVEHWGYVGKKREEKRERNTPLLLLSLEEEPEKLATYVRIIGDLALQPVEQKKYLLQGIEVAKKLIAQGNVHALEEGMLAYFHLALSRLAVLENDRKLQLELLDKVGGKFPDTIIELEHLGERLEFFMAQGNMEAYLPCFRRFLALGQRLEKNPDRIYSQTGRFLSGNGKFLPSHELDFLLYAVKVGKESLLEEFLPDLVGYMYENLQGKHIFLEKYLVLVKHLKSGRLLRDIYQYFQIHGTDEEKQEVEKTMVFCFSEFTLDSYRDLLASFSKESADMFLAPYIYEAHGCSVKACPDVEGFLLGNPELYTIHYRILLIDYLKTGKDSYSYIEKAPFSMLLEQFEMYWKQTKNPEQIMMEVFSREPLFCQTWKEKKLCGYLGLQTLAHLCEQKPVDWKPLSHLYQKASALLESYNSVMYQADVLQMGEADVMDSVELFAHHSARAWNSVGDDVAFVTAMKSALMAHQEYREVVKYFLSVMQEIRHGQIVKKQESQKPSLSMEQSDLSLNVKKTLGQLILAGKKEEARMILEKYKKINPHDPDLELLERTCGAI